MKTIWSAVKLLLLLSVLTGLVYPGLVTAVTNVCFKDKAEGSILSVNGKAVGSAWVGQNFTRDGYFWGRPSAGDYGTMSSSASNLTPAGDKVRQAMKENARKYANPSGGVADEMLFASGSGLDPHISPRAAFEQAARVAKARGKTEAEITALIKEHTEKRDLGFLGRERVNVLQLNLALDEMN